MLKMMVNMYWALRLQLLMNLKDIVVMYWSVLMRCVYT